MTVAITAVQGSEFILTATGTLALSGAALTGGTMLAVCVYNDTLDGAVGIGAISVSSSSLGSFTALDSMFNFSVKDFTTGGNDPQNMQTFWAYRTNTAVSDTITVHCSGSFGICCFDVICATGTPTDVTAFDATLGVATMSANTAGSSFAMPGLSTTATSGVLVSATGTARPSSLSSADNQSNTGWTFGDVQFFNGGHVAGQAVDYMAFSSALSSSTETAWTTSMWQGTGCFGQTMFAFVAASAGITGTVDQTFFDLTMTVTEGGGVAISGTVEMTLDGITMLAQEFSFNISGAVEQTFDRISILSAGGPLPSPGNPAFTSFWTIGP